MTAWLSDDAGLALLLIFAGLGLVFLLIAFAIEFWRAGELRRQARRRAAMQRYLNMVDREAAALLRRCRQPEEWEA